MCVQVFPTSALFHSTLMTCHSVHGYIFAGLEGFLFTAVMVLTKAPLSLLRFLSLLLWYFNFVNVIFSLFLSLAEVGCILSACLVFKNFFFLWVDCFLL